jgi:hypothetical protein
VNDPEVFRSKVFEMIDEFYDEDTQGPDKDKDA